MSYMYVYIEVIDVIILIDAKSLRRRRCNRISVSPHIYYLGRVL